MSLVYSCIKRLFVVITEFAVNYMNLFQFCHNKIKIWKFLLNGGFMYCIFGCKKQYWTFLEFYPAIVVIYSTVYTLLEVKGKGKVQMADTQ